MGTEAESLREQCRVEKEKNAHFALLSRSQTTILMANFRTKLAEREKLAQRAIACLKAREAGDGDGVETAEQLGAALAEHEVRAERRRVARARHATSLYTRASRVPHARAPPRRRSSG